MAEAKIHCINKAGGDHDNPHEAISDYGWIMDGSGNRGKSTRPQMVDWVEKGNHAYVTSLAGKVYCTVKISVKGTKFLQTESDGKPSNNLLTLPECK